MMYNDRTGASSAPPQLRELPGVTVGFYRALAMRGNTETADYFSRIISADPDRMGPKDIPDLVRGVKDGSDAFQRAYMVGNLLLHMNALASAGKHPHTVMQMERAFSDLFMPIATQSPRLALQITGAALNEPHLAANVRSPVAVAFANASFSLLRRNPLTAQPQLEKLARLGAEGGDGYILPEARERVVHGLVQIADNNSPDPAGRMRFGTSGSAISLAPEIMLTVVEAAGKISRDPHVQHDMAQRAERLKAMAPA